MVTVSEKAAARLKELMGEEKKDFLRVFVQGGGCSGFQYGMQIENEPQESDIKQESSGIRIYVDPISIRYLGGATIDFVENTTGGGFKITNPDAKSTCGCGQSFST